jgi:hypothetical protein
MCQAEWPAGVPQWLLGTADRGALASCASLPIGPAQTNTRSAQPTPAAMWRRSMRQKWRGFDPLPRCMVHSVRKQCMTSLMVQQRCSQGTMLLGAGQYPDPVIPRSFCSCFPAAALASEQPSQQQPSQQQPPQQHPTQQQSHRLPSQSRKQQQRLCGSSRKIPGQTQLIMAALHNCCHDLLQLLLLIIRPA